MAASDADGHIRALQLARDCIALGARMGTVVHVSGLRPAQLKTYFYRNDRSVNGRRPGSCEWVHWVHTFTRAEASEFASMFVSLRELQHCSPADALVAAYRMYVESNPSRPKLSFDRAFSLVCQLLGIWLSKEASLALHCCPRCHARYLAEIGATPPYADGCVFCHLLHRYPLDARIQEYFAGRQHNVPGTTLPGSDTETGP